jgi:hypothetical protein
MRREIVRLLLISLTLALLLSLSLPGISLAQTTHHVSPGDDIQNVIDNVASPGDTIEFALGTYNLTATLNVTKSLTLTSGASDPFNDPKPILDGGGTLGIIIYIDADYVTIDGLEVCNGTGDLISQNDSGGYDTNREQHTGTTITNCVVHGSSGDEGIELKMATNALIKCNKVYDVAEDGIAVADNSDNSEIRNNEIYNSDSRNGAIYVYDSYNITVKGNYIHDTTAANGITMYYNYSSTHTITSNLIVHNSWQGGTRNYDEADGNSINIYKPRENSTYNIKHNTLDDNYGVDGGGAPTGHAIYVNDGSSTGFVTNVDDNIITNHNGYGIRTYYGASVTYSYNDLWNNALGATDGVPVDGGNNIYVDPLFNSDYTLQAGSQCIDAASDGQDMGVVFGETGCGAPPPPTPTPTPPPSNGEGGGCFIATAAYGSYLDSHVETLRNFRDSYMVTNPVGSALVSAYYKLSPPVADFIDNHPALKPIVRVGLLPAVAMSTVAVSTTSVEKVAILGAVLLVTVIVAMWPMRKSRKVRRG